jgi:LCP family protein required for cell wall assembly
MPTLFRTNNDNHEEFKNNLLPDQPSIISSPTDGNQQNIVNSADNQTQQKKKKRFSIGKFISIVLILASLATITGGAYFGFTALSASGDIFGGGNSSFLDQLGQLGGALNPLKSRTPLKGEEEGRTNVLMIGKDSAAGLTDTIIIASYYHKEKKVVTLNIPRDFYVFDGVGSYKINAVAAFAEGRKTAGFSEVGGEEFLANFLAKEFGIPIHYWVSVNFAGFKSVIDQLGGIDVDVDIPFTDCEYPTDNYSGYIRPCPSFKQGTQKMDGTKALIYSRSRHGDNGQGSDFERGRRQQQIIQSVIATIKTQNLAINASKINAYLDILGKNMKTSVKLDEMLSAYEIFKGINIDEIKNNFVRVTWATGNGLLCASTTEDGAYIISYCGGAIAGRSGNSAARNKAKAFVQDILVQAQSNQLFEAPLVVLGNQSNDTLKAAGAMEKSGFLNLYSNNSWNKITAANRSSTEITEICFKDDKLKSLFDGLDAKPDFTFTVKDSCPAEWVLPTFQKDAKIIVWVSSK